MLIAVWLMALTILALAAVVVWQRLVIRVVARVAKDAGAQMADVDALAWRLRKRGN